jgi:hypothetical protein
MDDIVILSSDKSKLKKWFDDIEEFSQKKLELKMSKWQISSTTRGINFLGYRIWPKHKLLRKDSVLRAKRKIRKILKHKDQETLNKFIVAWNGHASHADTFNLQTYLNNILHKSSL